MLAFPPGCEGQNNVLLVHGAFVAAVVAVICHAARGLLIRISGFD